MKIISKEVYDNLPQMLKDLTAWCDDPYEKDALLLSSLAVLGGCFTGLEAVYRNDRVHSNLFAFICAPPASGKGRVKYARILAILSHNKIKQGNEEKMASYQLDLKNWQRNAKRTKDTSGTPPQRPKLPLLLAPSNVSAAALIQHLYDADGKLIFFETEADTLSIALSQDWGNFSDVLRKSFHNEPVSISRKGENLLLEIDKPMLSIVLTGTPNQLPGLFAKDDGLLSRFIFYRYEKEPKWAGLENSADAIDPEKIFLEKAHLVDTIKQQLDLGEHFFRLTETQIKTWDKKLGELVEKNKANGGTNSQAATIFRASVICFKIAMVLTVCRNRESLTKRKELVCADKDVQTALTLAELFIEHSPSSVERTNASNGHSPNPEEQLYRGLPGGDFTREQAVAIGKKIGISERSVGNYLGKLLTWGSVEKVGHGKYRRIIEPGS